MAEQPQSSQPEAQSPDATSQRPGKGQRPPKQDRDTYDPFVIQRAFPDPTTLLAIHPPIKGIAEECIFVLDANALLLPFRVGADSLADIQSVLVASKEVLYLPAQALREYARNRSYRVAELYDHVKHLCQSAELPLSLRTPMFESTEEYKAASKAAEAIRAPLKEYRAALNALTNRIADWNSDDPVSTLYATLFAGRIVHHELSDDAIRTDLDHRYNHNLPPGYKDGGKPDGGVGDLIIWHSIVALGKAKATNVIFVSNDKKADWKVNGKENSLFPRYELVEEYHRATGKHFGMMSYSDFLGARGAKAKTVKEVSEISPSIFEDAETRRAIQDLAAELRSLEGALFNKAVGKPFSFGKASVWPKRLISLASHVRNMLESALMGRVGHGDVTSDLVCSLATDLLGDLREHTNHIGSLLEAHRVAIYGLIEVLEILTPRIPALFSSDRKEFDTDQPSRLTKMMLRAFDEFLSM